MNEFVKNLFFVFVIVCGLIYVVGNNDVALAGKLCTTVNRVDWNWNQAALELSATYYTTCNTSCGSCGGDDGYGNVDSHESVDYYPVISFYGDKGKVNGGYNTPVSPSTVGRNGSCDQGDDNCEVYWPKYDPSSSDYVQSSGYSNWGGHYSPYGSFCDNHSCPNGDHTWNTNRVHTIKMKFNSDPSGSSAGFKVYSSNYADDIEDDISDGDSQIWSGPSFCIGGNCCGNNTIDYTLGEQCDDGNINNGDGCSSTCQKEPAKCSQACSMSGSNPFGSPPCITGLTCVNSSNLMPVTNMWQTGICRNMANVADPLCGAGGGTCNTNPVAGQVTACAECSGTNPQVRVYWNCSRPTAWATSMLYRDMTKIYPAGTAGLAFNVTKTGNFTDTGLANSTSYTYRMTQCLPSSDSPPVTVTTPNCSVPVCTPNCSDAPNVCSGTTFNDANGCGTNNCTGTMVTNCSCAASTPINQTCWDGCKTCNGTLNRPPTGTLGAAPCDNDPNGNGAWATIRGTAVDPDQMPTRARCRQNSGALTEVVTDASGNFSYTYPSLFGTNTIYCWAVDSTNSAVTTYLGSRSYTKINEATYSGANRCDVYYQLYVNGTQMNWGAANENKYGYLDGNCSQINYNVSPINYSYYTGSCTSSLINWKARVKGVMADGGKVNLRVVGHNDKYTAVFTGPCNSPSLSRVVGQEEFLQTKDYQCSIPQGIGLDPDNLDFDYTDVSFNGLPENVDATIRCTLNDEIVDITTNTVDIRKGELEACFNVVLVGQSAPYNIYNVSDNYLVSRCEGSVNFHIGDYLYDGENWGPMNGALSLYYNPATDNTSERFEYSGDVIVNPPPGFDQFIFPSF